MSQISTPALRHPLNWVIYAAILNYIVKIYLTGKVFPIAGAKVVPEGRQAETKSAVTPYESKRHYPPPDIE